MSTSKTSSGKGNNKAIGKLANETGIDETALAAVVGGTAQAVVTKTPTSIEKQAGNDGHDGANAYGNAALAVAQLQMDHAIPTTGATASTHVDSTHATATAGAGVTNTQDLGHGVNLVSTAGAQASADAHVGPLGAKVSAIASTQASETLNLTEHADITVEAHGVAAAQIKAGVTGVGASGLADVGATASVNQHESGSLGVAGLSGNQQTSVGVGVDAHAGGGIGVGLSGLKGGADAFAGAYAQASELAGISGHGVAASGTVGVYSPGAVGAHESFNAGVDDGKINLNVSIGGAFLLGGVNVGGNVSIDTKPIVDGAHIAGDAIAHVAAPVVAHAVTDAAHTVASGATDAAHTVASGTTAAASTVAHGATDAAHTVASTASTAAHEVAHTVSHTVTAAASAASHLTSEISSVASKVGMTADQVHSFMSSVADRFGNTLDKHALESAQQLAFSALEHAKGDITAATHAIDGALGTAGKFITGDAAHAISTATHAVETGFNTAVHAGEQAAQAAAHAITGAANTVAHGLEDAGHAIASFFCHTAGTRIAMQDGSYKAVEELKMGDQVMLGGLVIGRGEVLATDLYSYRGTVLNGGHAVFEDGRWVRVEDSAQAKLLDVPPATVYPIVTANHLLVCEQYICADVAEMDKDIGAVGRLAQLNASTARNRELVRAEEALGLTQKLAA